MANKQANKQTAEQRIANQKDGVHFLQKKRENKTAQEWKQKTTLFYDNLVLSTGLIMWIGHHKDSDADVSSISPSSERRANGRNASFRLFTVANSHYQPSCENQIIL